MRPAFSVIFLTTLIGAAQGVFLTVFAVECVALWWHIDQPALAFFRIGTIFSIGLSMLGLLASFFHLGHPWRAWRAVAMWRTSWLSRECLMLPLFCIAIGAYGVAHELALRPLTVGLGGLATLVCLALFISTGMIYTCIKVLREWASPLTTINFIALGSASGCTLTIILAVWFAPDWIIGLVNAAILLTLVSGAVRVAALRRNARLLPCSTLQSATGLTQFKIVQKSRGFTGDAFNTTEFFHGQTAFTLNIVKWGFLILVFVVPLLLLSSIAIGLLHVAEVWIPLAVVTQSVGLLAERWYFFADARHPQNLYYTGIS